MNKVFSILKKNDRDVMFYPIWNAEPGCKGIPQLTNVEQFPPNLDTLQVYACITNPWDLQKVHPSKVDKMIGELKYQKALCVLVLLCSKFTLKHLLELSYPSLSAIGSQVCRKEVDALESMALHAFVGLTNGWDSVSLTSKLQSDLEKHEEWMQGNAKSGFNALQFVDTEFPQIIVHCNQVHLPDGSNVLSESENEVVQYAYSLCKPNAVDAFTGDKRHVDGVLMDFKLHGNTTIGKREYTPGT